MLTILLNTSSKKIKYFDVILNREESSISKGNPLSENGSIVNLLYNIDGHCRAYHLLPYICSKGVYTIKRGHLYFWNSCIELDGRH